MGVLAVASLHGAPGATTLALDAARVCGSEALLIEADPDGGRLAARLDLAVRPGLTELAGAARVGIAASDIWRFAQPSSLGAAVIVGHPAAEQVHAALRAAVHHVGAALSDLEADVIVDLGRLRPGSPALGFATRADLTAVVVDNSIESVVALSHRARMLSDVPRAVLVLTRARPYDGTEIESACGVPVWGVIGPAGSRRSRASRRRAEQIERLLSSLGTPSHEPLAEELGASA